MNKLSIVGMVAGLMFLGALFFISGFLLAFNLYVLPNNQPPPTTLASVTPHRASPNALLAAHKPTPKAPPPATTPQQYATVGGVAMVPSPHQPTQAPSQQAPHIPYQQPTPAAPAPYPDARYAQQQPPVNRSYGPPPQYAPVYAPYTHPR